ncbi:hypothetical protein [Salinisphaera hydrothermalis]|uniref:Uncharacterized protein n=1 Tax=Salinisphaera hydrothermalis (strain C41B8) TaxID=1304275 RepID=A0A084IGN3_SALHC|nr:hypothetical protein [Salinisphaera hydrothermalis]KEZ75867.1 hypothetical protein C41B8_17893 [Salinisphaera hydrothermalis C41B8]
MTAGNNFHPGGRDLTLPTEQQQAVELIQRELQSCCADYDTLERTGQLGSHRPLARAIEMLRPSVGDVARQRALVLVNQYARHAVVSGNLVGASHKADDDMLFCLDCDWIGERWETAAGECPWCQADGSSGRLSDGDPMSRFSMYS